MCNCTEAAIAEGYIIQGGDYDELRQEFVKTNNFWMPLTVRDEKGKFRKVNLTIKHCPICGERLA